MQVEGTLGSIADEDIAQTWKTHWPEVARCSHAAQARLTYVTGTVQLKLRIGPDGMVTRAYVERSNLGNYEAERCVLHIARALQFPKPHGGSDAEFSFPIEVRARPSSPWVVAWEEARILPSVLRGKKDIGECKGEPPSPVAHAPREGKKHTTTKPVVARTPIKDLPASLAMTLYIAPGGRVVSVGFAAEGPIDETFAACLSERARTWKLDDPRSQIAKATVGVSP